MAERQDVATMNRKIIYSLWPNILTTEQVEAMDRAAEEPRTRILGASRIKEHLQDALHSTLCRACGNHSLWWEL